MIEKLEEKDVKTISADIEDKSNEIHKLEKQPESASKQSEVRELEMQPSEQTSLKDKHDDEQNIAANEDSKKGAKTLSKRDNRRPYVKGPLSKIVNTKAIVKRKYSKLPYRI